MFDFVVEVCVFWGVDDVDVCVFVFDCVVFCENCDFVFFFDVV